MASIKNTFRQISRDGRVGKKEVEQLIKSAIDGKGVTKTEAAELKKIRAEHGDKFTAAAGAAFDRFLSKMGRSWSNTKEVHLPNFDDADLQALFAADPRLGIYTGRSSGGGEASSTRGRTSGGGEASSSRSRTSGGGESSRTPSRPTRRSTGGGEYSPRPSYRPSYSSYSSYSYGGGE